MLTRRYKKLPLSGELANAVSLRGFVSRSGAANAAFRYDPSCEKAILENPQIFQNCEIINILSAEYAQSNAEGIPNRPAVGRKDFSFCIEMCF